MLEEVLREFREIKSLPQRRKWGRELARKLGEKKTRRMVRRLVEEGSKEAWELAAHMAPALVGDDNKLVWQVIERLAESEDWELREEAATVIKAVKRKVGFEELYPQLKRWVRQSAYLARAVSVGLIQRFKGEEKWLKEILRLFEVIMQYDDPYVKKNCGPFGLAAIFRRYPERTEKQLEKWVEQYPDKPTVLWNIMMVFSQANAKYFPEAGRRILDLIEDKVLRFPRLRRGYESVKKKVGVG